MGFEGVTSHINPHPRGHYSEIKEERLFEVASRVRSRSSSRRSLRQRTPGLSSSGASFEPGVAGAAPRGLRRSRGRRRIRLLPELAHDRWSDAHGQLPVGAPRPAPPRSALPSLRLSETAGQREGVLTLAEGREPGLPASISAVPESRTIPRIFPSCPGNRSQGRATIACCCRLLKRTGTQRSAATRRAIRARIERGFWLGRRTRGRLHRALRPAHPPGTPRNPVRETSRKSADEFLRTDNRS